MKSAVNIGHILCVLLLVLALPTVGLAAEETNTLGEQARKSWQELQNMPVPAEPTNIFSTSSIIWLGLILLLLLAVITLILLIQIFRLTSFETLSLENDK